MMTRLQEKEKEKKTGQGVEIRQMIPRRASVELKNTDPNWKILEAIQKIETNIRQEIKDSRDELRADFKKDMEELKNTMTELSEDMKGIKKKVTKLEMKTEEGLKERYNENLYDKVIPVLANLIECQPELLDLDVDKIFRINSAAAKNRNLPRDIVVYFTRERVKDRIIQESYKKKITVDGNELQIFKDIPGDILRRRRDYFNLTRVLQIKNIRYKWEPLEGISFMWRQRHYKIDTVEKAKIFYNRWFKEEEKLDKDLEVERRREEREQSQMQKEKEEEEKKKKEDKEEAEKEEVEGEDLLAGATGGADLEWEEELRISGESTETTIEERKEWKEVKE
ncbi:101 kDa malaria antigen-like [Sceloporus undulatus]|uniref:101 kDa malaria antigen-like n=1 Tax=Sceloporus undulatus TaxID=8520 RepID=UPI001C4D2A72|nr:101 kDa malaria antigen-like [Sceloporus undulatus]